MSVCLSVYMSVCLSIEGWRSCAILVPDDVKLMSESMLYDIGGKEGDSLPCWREKREKARETVYACEI